MHELIYGRQPVLEMLRAGRRRVVSVKLRETGRASATVDEIVSLAGQAGVRIESADPRALDRIAAGGHHQGVAAEVSAYPVVAFDELVSGFDSVAEDLLILVLDHIQDPQNLGALLRIADTAGVHGVVLPADRAAHVTPAAVRASTGAAEHMRVSVVTNLVRSMKGLKKLGLWCAGLEGLDAAQPLSEADLTGPLALVVGSEGQGLGRLVCQTCDFLVRIPLYGKVNSLNAAAAAGVALYEVRRQRKAQSHSLSDRN